MERPCLSGRVVLVVEDEALVGLDVRDLLKDYGAAVLLARNVKDALALAESSELAAAVLDINLAGDDCAPICQRLAERGIPFLFHTGYSEAPVLNNWLAAPVVRKPASGERIIEALTALNYALHRTHRHAAQ